MSSLRQIEANQRNAQHSTGPKTEEGKAQSRANALKHGLRSQVVIPQEYGERLDARTTSWTLTLKPEDEYQSYHLQQAVVASLKVEHCQVSETYRRVELAEVATDSNPKWDHARLGEAIHLGNTLKRNPELVAHQLRSTVAGRAWLIREWQHLLNAVPDQGVTEWGPMRTSEALDLLGTKKSLRELMSERREVFNQPTQIRELILAEIKALEVEQTNALAENASLRDLHAYGFGLESDATIKLLRRYETSAQRLLTQSIKAINKAKIPVKPTAKPTPKAVSHLAQSTLAQAVVPQSPEIAAQPEPPAHSEQPQQPALKGNRLYRKQRQAQARHQTHLAKLARAAR